MFNELSCNIVRFGCFLLRHVLHRTAGFGKDLKISVRKSDMNILFYTFISRVHGLTNW